MSLERKIEDVNSLISSLGSLDQRISGAIRALEERKDMAKTMLKKLMREKLVHGYDDLLSCLEDDFEIYPYADQIAAVDRTLKRLKRLQNLIASLKFRLMLLKELLRIISQLGPEIKKVEKAVGVLEKGMARMKKGIAEIEDSTSEILQRIGRGLSEVSTGPVPPVLLTGELENVMREMIDELRKELEEEGIMPPHLAVFEGPQAKREPLSLRPTRATTQSKPSGPSGGCEKLLLDYIRKNGGKIDIGECVRELGLPPEKVLEALKKLLEKGLIRIGGQVEGTCLAREGA